MDTVYPDILGIILPYLDDNEDKYNFLRSSKKMMKCVPIFHQSVSNEKIQQSQWKDCFTHVMISSFNENISEEITHLCFNDCPDVKAERNIRDMSGFETDCFTKTVEHSFFDKIFGNVTHIYFKLDIDNCVVYQNEPIIYHFLVEWILTQKIKDHFPQIEYLSFQLCGSGNNKKMEFSKTMPNEDFAKIINCDSLHFAMQLVREKGEGDYKLLYTDV